MYSAVTLWVSVAFGVALGALLYDRYARRVAVRFGWSWCLLRHREVEVVDHYRKTGEWSDNAPRRDRDGNELEAKPDD